VFLYKCSILKLHLLLISHEVALMRVLGLDGPCHLKIAPLIAHISASMELIGEPLMIHTFLDSVNYGDDVVDVFFKFFSFLQACHRDELRFLVCYCVEVATWMLASSR